MPSPSTIWKVTTALALLANGTGDALKVGLSSHARSQPTPVSKTLRANPPS